MQKHSNWIVINSLLNQLYKKKEMKKENFKLLFIAVALLINACKKEKIQTDIFDLKNYVVHSVYQETNGRGLNYKAPQQLLMSFQNNQTNRTCWLYRNTTIS